MWNLNQEEICFLPAGFQTHAFVDKALVIYQQDLKTKRWSWVASMIFISVTALIPFIPTYNICPNLALFWGRVISINFKEFILGKFTESPLSARVKRFKPKPTLSWKPLPSNFINDHKASGNLKEKEKVRFILSSPSQSSYGWECLISKILSGLMGTFFCNISCHVCNYLRKIRRWIYITCIKCNILFPARKEKQLVNFLFSLEMDVPDKFLRPAGAAF